MMTNELLRLYAVDGSETAFTELVRQHIDLVYSAALRQVNGDAAAAQDITQAVFTDLARKASRLAHHTSLTGWLYTSARFQAAKSRRAEQRRHAREQESHAMNQLTQTSDSADQWRDMRPVLDDVMHKLNEADREAVLLRYFERKPLAEVGARLGLSENAARMRVDRALEKLRSELSRRGVTSTAAALALALTERAVSAAPARLVAEVSKSALAAMVSGGLASGLFQFIGPTLLKYLAGAGAVAGLAVAVWVRHTQMPAVSQMALSAVAPPTNALPQVVVSTPALPAPSATTLDTTNKLTVHIVTADSGKPIPSVEFDYWIWGDGESIHRKPLHADRFGVCEVPVPRSTVTRLILVSERDGFADTRLQWHTDQGQTIPQEYTLRLARAVSIGGTVIDEDGNPVAGAKVGFNNRTFSGPDPRGELLTETADFGWPFWLEATTDSAGHWQIDRVAKGIIQTLFGTADEPAHLEDHTPPTSDPNVGKQLIAGTYVFHLGRAMEISGNVTDTNGTPIPGATVRAGYAAMSPRKAKTGPPGRFSIVGCKPEKMPLTAFTKGFAATTIQVDLTTNRGPFHLTLEPGKVARIRIVDAKGNGIPKAWVAFNNMPQWNVATEQPPAVQADFEKTADNNGRVEWDEAPDADLKFDSTADGYLRGAVHFRPDGNEHMITLHSGLTLFGAVTDASTGQPLPGFRIIVGHADTNLLTGELNARWGTPDRFWLKFDGTTYRHLFDEPLLGKTSDFIFKFEAEGYAPFVTRVFSIDEGEVQTDVALQPAVVSSIGVLLPDGSPAIKADVGMVFPGAGLELLPGGLSHDHLPSAESLSTTDESGHFSFSSDDSVKGVVIAHPEGFIKTTPGALNSATTIQLQPWGRIEGTLMYEDKPSSGRSVQFQFDNKDFQTFRPSSEKYTVTTDAAGNFLFPQVPPGKGKLVLLIPFDGGRGLKGVSAQLLTNVDVVPGETVTMTPATTIAPGTTITLPRRLGAAQPSGQ